MINLDQVVVPPNWTIGKGDKSPIANWSLSDTGTVEVEAKSPENFLGWLHKNFSPEDIDAFTSYGDEKEKLLLIAAQNEDVVIETLGPGHRKVTWASFNKQMEYMSTINPHLELINNKIWFLWHTNQGE